MVFFVHLDGCCFTKIVPWLSGLLQYWVLIHLQDMRSKNQQGQLGAWSEMRRVRLLDGNESVAASRVSVSSWERACRRHLSVIFHRDNSSNVRTKTNFKGMSRASACLVSPKLCGWSQASWPTLAQPSATATKSLGQATYKQKIKILLLAHNFESFR